MGLFDLLEDIVKVAIAPVVIAVDVVGAVVKPVAQVAEAAVEGVRETLKEIME